MNVFDYGIKSWDVRPILPGYCFWKQADDGIFLNSSYPFWISVIKGVLFYLFIVLQARIQKDFKGGGWKIWGGGSIDVHTLYKWVLTKNSPFLIFKFSFNILQFFFFLKFKMGVGGQPPQPFFPLDMLRKDTKKNMKLITIDPILKDTCSC